MPTFLDVIGAPDTLPAARWRQLLPTLQGRHRIRARILNREFAGTRHRRCGEGP
jgi:hypothetical protein